MSFTSVSFLIFALATVIAYYIIPIRYRWVVLLAASYAFYLLSSPNTFIFVLFTTAVTYAGGRWIGNCNDGHKAYLTEHRDLSRSEKKELKARNQKKKRLIVALILVIDFGILAVLKYFRYYLQLAGIFDTGALLIPLGISFYTFQSAAYIFDLYRNKIDADKNIGKFALFTAFFPQIIQGPISRHDQLAHQLYEGNRFSYTNLAHGAQLILWGFFKKLVIADRVAILCSQVFNNHTDYTGGAVFTAMVFYTIQIYADFSGGIDIARGVAQCMGIEMTDNFKRPYFANSLSEFWNRWHISLSFWCRDYIFYPVALSKFFGKIGKNLRRIFGDRIGKLFPAIIAQYCTFVTIGLWHGADFKFVAYGLYNGTIIVLALLLDPYFKSVISKLHINVNAWWWKGFQIIRTFFIVVFGRLFPKAASFSVAISMFCSVFKPNTGTPFSETIMSLGLGGIDFAILFVCCCVWFIVSLIEERSRIKTTGDSEFNPNSAVRLLLDEKPIILRWALFLLLLTAVLSLGVYGPGYDVNAFIYRGF